MFVQLKRMKHYVKQAVQSKVDVEHILPINREEDKK